MAELMATNQIGTTVLCLYPTPNCLKDPSGIYAKAGWTKWNRPKNKKKHNMAK